MHDIIKKDNIEEILENSSSSSDIVENNESKNNNSFDTKLSNKKSRSFSSFSTNNSNNNKTDFFHHRKKEKESFTKQESVLEVKRVTKTTTGGKNISFNALVVVSIDVNEIGIGFGKGPDVTGAISKATNNAYKNGFRVALSKNGNTIPHDVTAKHNSTKIILKKAPEGTGFIFNSKCKTIFNFLKIENVVGKIYGSTNFSNLCHTLKKLLQKLESPHSIAKRRKKTIEIFKKLLLKIMF